MPAPRRSPHASSLCLLLLLACSPWVLAQALPLPGPHAASGGEQTAAPGARHAGAGQATATDAEQAAVAAVLVATLGDRFGQSMMELRLDAPLVDIEGPREHVVHGVGYLRFTGEGDDWLAFRYRSRYDPLFGSAGYPEVVLGGDGEADDERFVPNDALLLGDLEARVATDLEALPGAGRVFLQLDDISSTQSGERFVRIEAGGLADFGPGGSTSARVDALYDLRAGAWLSIEHALGPNIRVHDEGVTAGP